MIAAFLRLTLLPVHLHVFSLQGSDQVVAEHGVHAHFPLDPVEHHGEHRHVVDLDRDTLAKKLIDPLEPAAALLVLLLLLPPALARSDYVPTRSVVPPHSPPAALLPPLRAPPHL
ncbi:MAG TPA: hypothetical protein VK971_09960 [Thiohalobacter sp.]|nr:hypothetical protein [Thiohalobacter sp.]